MSTKNTTKIRIREMYIGNPEIYVIGSGTKLFITFLSLRFFDMGRERHNFFLCWLFVNRQLSTHWLNKRAAHFVDPNWYRGDETKNRLPTSRLESQLTAFFSNPQILSASGYDIIHVPCLFPIWGFYCDIFDCHIRTAPAWTPALKVCT